MHLQPDITEVRLLSFYDYIVVGGGVAGLVVANRVTDEDPIGKERLLCLLNNTGRLLTYFSVSPGARGGRATGHWLFTSPEGKLTIRTTTLKAKTSSPCRMDLTKNVPAVSDTVLPRRAG